MGDGKCQIIRVVCAREPECNTCISIIGTRERGAVDEEALSAALTANDGIIGQGKAMAPDSSADFHDRLLFFPPPG